MLFLNTLRANCLRYNDKTALELDGKLVSYAQLEAHVRRAMSLLQTHGVAHGDCVAIQLPKSLPFIWFHLATMRLGAISMPLNPAYPDVETAYFLEDAAVRLHIVADDRPSAADTLRLDHLDSQRTLAQLEPSDAPLPSDSNQVALMIYTSGTTGRPKGAQITHANLTANLDSLHEAWEWRDDDVLLHVLPIFHIHGLVVALHGALNAGARVVMMGEFSADFTLQTLADRRCTVLMGVPTIHRRLVASPLRPDLSHMRLLTSGSDRLPDDLFTAFRQKFAHTLLERYGMTETGINLSNPLHGERRVGSVGLPLPGVEARIADPETGNLLPDGVVGEVQIRGANLFKGYWQMPDKTAAAFTPDGWLHTGDLGLREPDGYFTLKGRSKDLIITGGLNVYPPEVELALMELDSVAACAVVGVPDAEWGERVAAVIIPHPSATLTADQVTAHCRQRLAPYKIPRRIEFTDALPRNALGKVQKATLRQQLTPQGG